MEAAHIILVLISADFIASDYCYAVEMRHAFERHKAGTAWVIPILLRPVEWERTPLGELSPLPTNRVPVTLWANPDAAWLNVVQGISEVVRKLLPKPLLSPQDADILYAEQGSLSGQIVGEKYLLGELIGEGGFSLVYKAQHLLIQRQQAVKVLLERHFRKQEFHDRFLREARTIASLDHPHIIHLDDFWVDAPQAYLVMPYMSGGTLQGILEKSQGFLGQDHIIFYLEHICAALDYAHKQGIAHLDLKPLNLLVHEDGRLLLSDFGLAHLMKDGAIAGGSSLRVGTPHYMAPEHIKGFPERRSDLFSLGVILYQMLVGRLPFDGLPQEAILMKNIAECPPAPRVLRPGLPQAIEDIVRRALAKQPEQRYQTANDLLIAFKKALVAPQKPTSRPPSRLVPRSQDLVASVLPTRSPGSKYEEAKGFASDHGGNDKRITATQVSAVLRQAQAFQAQGRFNDAIALCEQILENGFDRPDARYFLGWLYQAQNRWNDAIRQFQLLLNDPDNDPDYALSCHYALGQCYRVCGDLRTAIMHFDEAVDRVNLVALTVEEADQLVHLYQEAAEAHHQLGEKERAMEIYNALLGFLRDRGWSAAVDQVESMLRQIQK